MTRMDCSKSARDEPWDVDDLQSAPRLYCQPDVRFHIDICAMYSRVGAKSGSHLKDVALGKRLCLHGVGVIGTCTEPVQHGPILAGEREVKQGLVGTVVEYHQPIFNPEVCYPLHILFEHPLAARHMMATWFRSMTSIGIPGSKYGTICSKVAHSDLS